MPRSSVDARRRRRARREGPDDPDVARLHLPDRRLVGDDRGPRRRSRSGLRRSPARELDDGPADDGAADAARRRPLDLDPEPVPRLRGDPARARRDILVSSRRAGWAWRSYDRHGRAAGRRDARRHHVPQYGGRRPAARGAIGAKGQAKVGTSYVGRERPGEDRCAVHGGAGRGDSARRHGGRRARTGCDSTTSTRVPPSIGTSHVGHVGSPGAGARLGLRPSTARPHCRPARRAHASGRRALRADGFGPGRRSGTCIARRSSTAGTPGACATSCGRSTSPIRFGGGPQPVHRRGGDADGQLSAPTLASTRPAGCRPQQSGFSGEGRR